MIIVMTLFSSRFLLVSLYVLLYVALMKPQPQTIVISPVTPLVINRFHLEHTETLSCPCSNSSIPYKHFVSNTIRFHPICTSTFISEEWINALNLPDASKYGVRDFRTTASSQVSQYYLSKKSSHQL